MDILGRNVWRFKSTNPYRTEVETYLQKLEKYGVWLDVLPGQGSHSGNTLNTFGFNNYMSDRYSFVVPTSPSSHELVIYAAIFMGITLRVDVEIRLEQSGAPAGTPIRTVLAHAMLFAQWPAPEKFMGDVFTELSAQIDLVMSSASSIM
jgi:hypothetical protein